MQKDSIYTVKRLANNEDYYNSVFKKTEKIISVVFYIMSYIDRNDVTSFHIKTLTDKTVKVQEETLLSLSFFESEAKEKIFPLQQSLVGLVSVLQVTNSARVISDEVFNLLVSEIDLVQRYLKNHFTNTAPTALEREEATELPAKPKATKSTTSPSLNNRFERTAIPKGDISSDAHFVYSQLVDRGTRIKTVLEAKPEATIKDIAEVITDVSEKTIQRELNSLIEKGQVIREGERRWSKYSVAK